MSLFSSLRKSRVLQGAVFASLMLGGFSANLAHAANVYINEIHFNPGFSSGSSDQPDKNEFIELRGTPSANLANYYLVILENEAPSANNLGYGTVEVVFNLGKLNSGSAGSLGTDSGDGYGYAVILPKNFNRTNYTLASGAHEYQNTGNGPGYGWDVNADDAQSTIGFSQRSSETSNNSHGYIENSGFTALLIEMDPEATVVPTIDQNYDSGDGDSDYTLALDNALEDGSFNLVDSIGVEGETEPTGRLYGAMNFVINSTTHTGGATSHVISGTSVCVINPLGTESFNEIEYIGRWGNGNSTDGSTPADWMAANLKKSDNAQYLLDFEGTEARGLRGDGSAVTSYYNQTTQQIVTNTYGSENHHN